MSLLFRRLSLSITPKTPQHGDEEIDQEHHVVSEEKLKALHGSMDSIPSESTADCNLSMSTMASISDRAAVKFAEPPSTSINESTAPVDENSKPFLPPCSKSMTPLEYHFADKVSLTPKAKLYCDESEAALKEMCTEFVELAQQSEGWKDCGVKQGVHLFRRAKDLMVRGYIEFSTEDVTIEGILHYLWHKSGKNDYAEVGLYALVVAGLLGHRLWVRLRRVALPN